MALQYVGAIITGSTVDEYGSTVDLTTDVWHNPSELATTLYYADGSATGYSYRVESGGTGLGAYLSSETNPTFFWPMNVWTMPVKNTLSNSGTNSNNSTTTTNNNSNTGNSTSSTIINAAKNLFSKATAAGALKLEVDPNNPKTTGTRYNESTGQIEYYVTGSNQWVPVTIVFKNNTKGIDISKFTLKEIQGYLETGLPFPSLEEMPLKKLTASTEAPQTTSKKWLIWVLVGLLIVAGLFVLYKISAKTKKKNREISAPQLLGFKRKQSKR